MGQCQSRRAVSEPGNESDVAAFPVNVAKKLLCRSHSEQSITIIPEVDEVMMIDPAASCTPRECAGKGAIISPTWTEPTVASTLADDLGSPASLTSPREVNSTSDDDEDDLSRHLDDDNDITSNGSPSSIHAMMVMQSCLSSSEVIPEEVDPDAPSDEEEFHENNEQRLQREYNNEKHGLDEIEPGPLLWSKLNMPTKKAPSQLQLIAPSSAPEWTHHMVQAAEKSSVSPQMVSHFQRLCLQQKIQKQENSRQKRKIKREDRLQDVQSYKKLLQQFEQLQQGLTPTAKKEADEDIEQKDSEPASRGVKRSDSCGSINSFDLKESGSWFFDFQSHDFAFEGRDDVKINQSTLSLLSASSLEAQQRFFKECKRRKGKLAKTAAWMASGNRSVCSAPAMQDSGSLQSRDYGPARLWRRNGSASKPPRISLTNMEVSFAAPTEPDAAGMDCDQHQENHETGSIISDLDDGASSIRSALSYDYGVVRRKNFCRRDSASTSTAKLEELEEKIRILMEKAAAETNDELVKCSPAIDPDTAPTCMPLPPTENRVSSDALKVLGLAVENGRESKSLRQPFITAPDVSVGSDAAPHAVSESSPEATKAVAACLSPVMEESSPLSTATSVQATPLLDVGNTLKTETPETSSPQEGSIFTLETTSTDMGMMALVSSGAASETPLASSGGARAHRIVSTSNSHIQDLDGTPTPACRRASASNPVDESVDSPQYIQSLVSSFNRTFDEGNILSSMVESPDDENDDRHEKRHLQDDDTVTFSGAASCRFVGDSLVTDSPDKTATTCSDASPSHAQQTIPRSRASFGAEALDAESRSDFPVELRVDEQSLVVSTIVATGIKKADGHIPTETERDFRNAADFAGSGDNQAKSRLSEASCSSFADSSLETQDSLFDVLLRENRGNASSTPAGLLLAGDWKNDSPELLLNDLLQNETTSSQEDEAILNVDFYRRLRKDKRPVSSLVEPCRVAESAPDPPGEAGIESYTSVEGSAKNNPHRLLVSANVKQCPSQGVKEGACDAYAAGNPSYVVEVAKGSTAGAASSPRRKLLYGQASTVWSLAASPLPAASSADPREDSGARYGFLKNRISELSTEQFLRMSGSNALANAARVERNEVERNSISGVTSGPLDTLYSFSAPIGLETPHAAQPPFEERGCPKPSNMRMRTFSSEAMSDNLVLAESVEAQVKSVLQNYRRDATVPIDAPQDEQDGRLRAWHNFI